MISDKLLDNTDVVIGKDELMESLSSGRKLKVKFGVDPTRPDLTFGHLVVFNKLRQFQDAGHEAILLIGDYTARIGDPSGRSEAQYPGAHRAFCFRVAGRKHPRDPGREGIHHGALSDPLYQIG